MVRSDPVNLELDRPLRCLVIVPAFNESASLGKLITRLHRALPAFDIVVIDDGSTDATIQSIPPFAKVISLPFNLGIGGAMQTGYRYAALHGYDVAIQVDGDGQHRPSEVARLVEILQKEDADLAIGSRFVDGIRYRQTFVRMTGIRVLGMLIKTLTGLKVTDCTSGFRAVNRRVIRAFAHWYPEDYPEPEVVLLLKRNGCKITETPVKMRQRRTGVTSIPFLKGAFYVAKVTVALFLDMIREPWPSGKVEEHEFHPQPDPDPVRYDAPPPGRPTTPSIQT